MHTDVRGYRDSDRTALADIFGRAGAGTPSAELWGHSESEAAIYLTPYLDREPQHASVALADGEIVGYLVGAADTASFPSEDDRFRAAMREHRVMNSFTAQRFFARAALDSALDRLRRRPMPNDLSDPAYPAHLHIDLVPEARGAGLGRALMQRYLGQLRDAGVPGCHLGTLVENEPAVRFFTAMGFTPHGPTPPIPGMRWHGKRVHQQLMVQRLEG